MQMLDAVISLKDNFSDTLQNVNKEVGNFQRTLKGTGYDIQRTGSNLQSLGGTMTKSFTAPIIAATTAAGGLVASLGWGRLTGLDAARSQLQGLGYDAESVERISSLVNEAIQGTTTTMADGVATAAGALAAGVKEGAELERYIKLVGDAAVGAGRDTGSMAQIFNRVQGAGKLMTQELNMIEDGMPGFAMAMADGLGVPQAEFREMVTAGKVSSNEFLDVMESFAGEMSDAYAGSWAGIVSRTKSNIGILGETMLGGVFEQSKESLAEFLEYIRTDEVRGWFKETGESIGDMFTNVLGHIKDGIEWWRNLDDSTKDFIIRLAGMVIAAGPFLTILGKMTSGIGGVVKELGFFAQRVGKGGFLSAIFTPGIKVALVLSAIAGAAILVYKNWDKIKPVIDRVKDGFQEFWDNTEPIRMWVKESLVAAFEAFKEKLDEVKVAFEPLVPLFEELWEEIQTLIPYLQPVLEFFAGVFAVGIVTQVYIIIEAFMAIVGTIAEVATGIITTFQGITTFLTGVFTGDWETAWEGVKTIFAGVIGIIEGIWNGAVELLTSPIDAVINLLDNNFGERIGNIKAAWENIKEAFKSPITGTINLFTNGGQAPVGTRTRSNQGGGRGGGSYVANNFAGTDFWRGGLTYLHERGGEIYDLPRGTRVYPHDKSVEMARQEGAKSAQGSRSITIAKLADAIHIREEADIDKLTDRLVRKLEETAINMA